MQSMQCCRRGCYNRILTISHDSTEFTAFSPILWSNSPQACQIQGVVVTLSFNAKIGSGRFCHPWSSPLIKYVKYAKYAKLQHPLRKIRKIREIREICKTPTPITQNPIIYMHKMGISCLNMLNQASVGWLCILRISRILRLSHILRTSCILRISRFRVFHVFNVFCVFHVFCVLHVFCVYFCVFYAFCIIRWGWWPKLRFWSVI